MANASHDSNHVPTLLGVSSSDGTTPVPIYADASTHRLLVSTGGITALPITSKTSTYQITTSDYTINATSGTFTTTLPTAIGVDGRVYIIKNSGSGTVTLATTSSQTIDGLLTETLSQYDFITVQSDGANWITIG